MELHISVILATALGARPSWSQNKNNAGKMPALPDSTSHNKGPRGWYSRGYLPHFDGGEVPQAITFRLADSLPRERLNAWENELSNLPIDEAETERRRRVEAYLDAGHGEAWLADPRIAALVEGALLHFDGERYYLHSWVVMPNHVHVLITPQRGHCLPDIIHSWKSFTANKANRVLDRNGPFWQAEYYDRYIRNDHHFAAAIAYIEDNPVKAGLCSRREEWRYSSAAPEHMGARPSWSQNKSNAGRMPALPERGKK